MVCISLEPIHSADGTVNTSFYPKLELIRINLFLIKLLAILMGEMRGHLTLKNPFSFSFYIL